MKLLWKLYSVLGSDLTLLMLDHVSLGVLVSDMLMLLRR